MSRDHGITTAVLETFAKHPGETIFINDLVQDTGFDRKQIQGCITNNIYRKAEVFTDVHIVQPGNAWSYRPNRNKVEAKPAKRLFEEIGETKSGSLVIQDSEGNLWRATQLD